jgi:adenosylcobinamide-GDP ribazoletransferase
MAGTMRLATHSGLGADYGRGTTRGRAFVGTCSGVAVTAVAVGWHAAPLAAAAFVAVAAVGALARHKIGGISGDVLGATEQVAECLCLVVISGLA